MKKKLAGIFTALFMIGVGGVAAPAGAATLTTASSSSICANSAILSGECIGAVYQDGVQDPVVEGVRQALQRGDNEQAASFVHKRGLRTQDLAQIAAEGLLAVEAKAGPEAIATELPGSRLITADGQAVTTNSAREMQDDPGVIYEGITYEVDTIQSYTYCTTDGSCLPAIGSIHILFDHYIGEYPETTIAGGRLEVNGTDSVTFTQFRCRTQYESFPIDQIVHEWNVCRSAQSPTPTKLKNIFTENWIQGGTNDAKYHNDYLIAFKPGNGTGNELTIEWTAPSYTVLPGTGARFR